VSVLLIFSACATISSAQRPDSSPYYARRNTFGVFGAYSGDSSHILLGDAENRRLLEFGVSYSRRLVLNHTVNWQYNAEFLPVALESDPMSFIVNKGSVPNSAIYTFNSDPVVSCAPISYSYSTTDPGTGITYQWTSTISCKGRRWVMGQAMSPVGLQWNFLPQRKTQPFLVSHGGYMYSTKPIPLDDAGSFNFTFDLGAGFEIFRTKSKSIRAEYRYHHISNHNTARRNPGIDNGLVQVTYSFGR
jgi:opacity protein-like surface antigen